MRVVPIMAVALLAAGAPFARLIASAPAQQNSASQAQATPDTDCDTYAASDLDPQRRANGIPFDKIDSAIPACERAVRKYPNSTRLIYQLGRAYAKKNDFKTAFVQYQKAADQGYVLAEYNLGVLYEKGWGVAMDEAQAAAWYRKAAQQGFVLAQSNLGNMYRNGQGVAQNYPEALSWLRKAAEQGNARAMGTIGVMYANAQGVPQDYTEAVSWWLKAAEQGEMISQAHLGIAYYSGQGVPQNHSEAAKWFRLAADQGYADAQYLLGLLYEHGDGVPKNLTEAADWYRKAAAQGNVEAHGKLAALDADAKAGRAAKLAGDATFEQAPAATPKTDSRQPNWKKIEMDNGAILAFDLNKVERGRGMADVTLYIDPTATGTYEIHNVRFDCQGHMIAPPPHPTVSLEPIITPLPPRSAGAQVQAIVCAGAGKK
jgi:TPR repeat protein